MHPDPCPPLSAPMDPLAAQVGSQAWRSHRQALEEAELAAPLCRPPAQVYAKLLLCYLMEKEIMLAKFLWKRIPEETRASEPTLERIWGVGRALAKRDPQEVHQALAGEWPEHCADYIQKLREICRDRFLHLVGEAYSSISPSDLARFLGSSSEEEAVAAVSAGPDGWGVDAETGMVLPARREAPSDGPPPSEEKLRQLTDYICFLEK